MTSLLLLWALGGVVEPHHARIWVPASPLDQHEFVKGVPSPMFLHKHLNSVCLRFPWMGGNRGYDFIFSNFNQQSSSQAFLMLVRRKKEIRTQGMKIITENDPTACLVPLRCWLLHRDGSTQPSVNTAPPSFLLGAE